MPSIFTRIINGEIPCYKVAENEEFLAFLDINPVQKGHCLIVPKKETDYIFDLSEQEYINLQLFARKIALAIQKVIPCKKIASTVVGLEVPHVHIHLVPLQNLSFINFAAPRIAMSELELQQTALLIQQSFLQNQ